jgi:hypothetical protein
MNIDVPTRATACTSVVPLFLLSVVLAGACSFTGNDGTGNFAVRCSRYDVTMSRVNGALTSITLPGGGILSRGSRNGCLYGMSGNETYCGSCGCSHGNRGPTMAAAWDNVSLSLTLTFTAGSAAGPTATVSLQAYDDSPYFDLTFRLTASPTDGAGYSWLEFPSEILFDTAGLRALHAPILPGLTLGPGFFRRGVGTTWFYPGR